MEIFIYDSLGKVRMSVMMMGEILESKRTKVKPKTNQYPDPR